MAQRLRRGIALLFHDRGTRRWWAVSSTPRPHFTPGERPGTHFTGGWVGPRASLACRRNLVLTAIRSRILQPVAQSLYRLSYPVHDVICKKIILKELNDLWELLRAILLLKISWLYTNWLIKSPESVTPAVVTSWMAGNETLLHIGWLIATLLFRSIKFYVKFCLFIRHGSYEENDTNTSKTLDE